jgi:hypothetical protein
LIAENSVTTQLKKEHIMVTELITDSQYFVSAKYSSGYEIQTYDDGYGQLWISRSSTGINGIVRAQSWEDAYSICEDEFFPEAYETMEEIVKEYGFKRERVKIVKDSSVTVATEHCAAGERIARYPEDYPEGRLKPEFIRWETIETTDPDAWMDNGLFQDAFGFRSNGPNSRDTLKHCIYAKDLNGDALDLVTPELLEELGIVLEIKDEEGLS